jgi:hypothetical protein
MSRLMTAFVMAFGRRPIMDPATHSGPAYESHHTTGPAAYPDFWDCRSEKLGVRADAPVQPRFVNAPPGARRDRILLPARL